MVANDERGGCRAIFAFNLLLLSGNPAAPAVLRFLVIDVDYRSLPEDLESGLLRQRLRDELAAGFQAMHEEGERLPPPSYYATRIVDIIHQGAPVPLEKGLAFNLYQEVVLACEEARAEVLGEEDDAPPSTPG